MRQRKKLTCKELLLAFETPTVLQDKFPFDFTEARIIKELTARQAEAEAKGLPRSNINTFFKKDFVTICKPLLVAEVTEEARGGAGMQVGG